MIGCSASSLDQPFSQEVQPALNLRGEQVHLDQREPIRAREALRRDRFLQLDFPWKQLVAAEVIVMPRSFSCSIQSIVAEPSSTSPSLWLTPV